MGSGEINMHGGIKLSSSGRPNARLLFLECLLSVSVQVAAFWLWQVRKNRRREAALKYSYSFGGLVSSAVNSSVIKGKRYRNCGGRRANSKENDFTLKVKDRFRSGGRSVKSTETKSGPLSDDRRRIRHRHCSRWTGGRGGRTEGGGGGGVAMSPKSVL